MPHIGTERQFLARQASVPASRIIASPFQFWMSGEDALLLRTWSGIATTVSVEGRWLDTNHEIQVLRHRFPTSSDRIAELHEITVGPGFLLNCSISTVGTSSVTPGRCFAQLRIIRGSSGARVELGTLLQGYVGSANFLAWPGSAVQTSYEGPGHIAVYQKQTPPAGNEVGWTPQPNQRVRLISMETRLTAAVGGSNRVPLLQLLDGSAVRAGLFPTDNTVAAGTSRFITWAPGTGGGPHSSPDIIGGPLPSQLIAFPGITLSTTTLNLAAGDQYANLKALVEEWILVDTLTGLGIT